MRQLERVQAIAAGDSRMREVVTECECGQLPALVPPWPVIDNPVYGDAPTVHESQPIPDTAFYRPMRAGHLIRTGHALAGRLVTDDGEIWRLERSCCGVTA